MVNREIAGDVVGASPPVAVVGLTLGGITLQDWVYLLTLIHLLLLIGWFIYSKFIRKPKADGE